MRYLAFGLLLCLCLTLPNHSAADVYELVRSGNGFVYDAPIVPTLELADDNLPAQEEFNVESLSTSASELLPAGSSNVGVPYQQQQFYAPLPPLQQQRGLGYQYQVPSKTFSGY